MNLIDNGAVRICLAVMLFAAAAGSAQEAEPVSREVWTEAVISVTDLDRTAAFFVDIGGFEEKWRGPLEAAEVAFWGLGRDAGAEALLLGPPGQDTGLVRLIRFDSAGRKEPTRPGARAWDTGCYYSLVVHMKDMQSIYDDAIRMGWWTETPVTYVALGKSRLNVTVFRGPDGVQVKGYEQLEPPLPGTIPAFKRLSRPFNILQTVRDGEVSYDFFTRVLGFDTLYTGEPVVAEEPEHMPLGIPKNLTTSVRYTSGIVYPRPGEFGRMQMIEIMDLEGYDNADRCNAPNLGILAVRFPVKSTKDALYEIAGRGGTIEVFASGITISPYGKVRLFNVKSPDGANIHFFEQLDRIDDVVEGGTGSHGF